MSDEFKHLEGSRNQLGELYVNWKEKYGDQISINYVDPRNTSMIASYLFKQRKKGNISLFDAIKHLLFHVKLDAIFVNGYYLENKDDFDKIVNNMLDAKGDVNV
ncbi:hypothetical protein E3U55_12560 [Filobacillus milosensis]|uniref:Uncharacterized protein n=1 Tax=Filobacillus milosensis TaxID=94137 RepID=A0A4Y8IF06_9BACI|nr:hypothetical protein [Filobacillus milosensis]TFB15078.1 hypothetical protein E3U55_12560 [Filobacillus milosensis]